jgi:hypothetical protein
MTDTEVRIHDAMNVLAGAELVATPSVDELFERARSAGKPRRTRTVAVAVALGASVMVSAAGGAAGKLPGGIERAFHRISSWSESCRVDQSSARLVASFRRPDGRTIEWWRATGTRATGDETRWVDPDGSSHEMTSSCTVDRFPPGQLMLGGTSDDGNPAEAVSWGLVPTGATAVRAVYSDGATVDVPLQHGRYFMAGLDRGVDGTDGSDTPLRIEALGATGTVISSARER